MNFTNHTDYDDYESETDEETKRENRKIEDGKYILMIYIICVIVILVHLLMCFHIIFGCKSVKEYLRKVFINNRVTPQELGFSYLWTAEPINQ